MISYLGERAAKCQQEITQQPDKYTYKDLIQYTTIKSNKALNLSEELARKAWMKINKLIITTRVQKVEDQNLRQGITKVQTSKTKN